MTGNFNYLRISITDRCNLRCRYCVINPAEKLKAEDILSFEEIVRIVKIVSVQGVKTVRITGGEPLMRSRVNKLFKMITDISNIKDVTFTTNGINLDIYAAELYDFGVKRFNFSLDSLNREKYCRLTGKDNLEKIITNIKKCIKIGFSPIKMNVVALKGINDDEIHDFIEFAETNGLILRFIELMNIADSAQDFFKKHFISVMDIKKIINEKYKLNKISNPAFPGSGPAVYSQLESGLKIGFISPVSEHFCAACNRLRLTANGMIKPCLLRPGEINIKQMIKSGASDNELAKAIVTVFENKQKACGKFSKKNTMFTNMSQIGG